MLTDALLTQYGLPFFLVLLMSFMAFIVYRLGVDAKVGRFGMFVIVAGLMIGAVGFSTKFVLKIILDTSLI